MLAAVGAGPAWAEGETPAEGSITATPNTNLAAGSQVTVTGSVATCRGTQVDDMLLLAVEGQPGEAYPEDGMSLAGTFAELPTGTDDFTLTVTLSPLIDLFETVDIQVVCSYDDPELGAIFIPVGRAAVTSLAEVPPLVDQPTPTLPAGFEGIQVSQTAGLKNGDVVTVTGPTAPCAGLEQASVYVLAVATEEPYPTELGADAAGTTELPEGDVWTVTYLLGENPARFAEFDLIALCQGSSGEAVPIGRVTVTSGEAIIEEAVPVTEEPTLFAPTEPASGNAADPVDDGAAAGDAGDGGTGEATTNSGAIPGAVWPLAAIGALVLGLIGAFLVRRSRTRGDDDESAAPAAAGATAKADEADGPGEASTEPSEPEDPAKPAA
jgi:hypothetical protein